MLVGLPLLKEYKWLEEESAEIYCCNQHDKVDIPNVQVMDEKGRINGYIKVAYTFKAAELMIYGE